MALWTVRCIHGLDVNGDISVCTNTDEAARLIEKKCGGLSSDHSHSVRLFTKKWQPKIGQSLKQLVG